MKQNLLKNDGPGYPMTSATNNRPASAVLVAALLATLSLACSNNASKSPPQRPSSNATGGIQESASPTKGTSSSSASRNSRNKDDADAKDAEEDSSDEPPRPGKTSTSPKKDTGTPPKSTTSKNPPLDPALAQMTCDAPPIRGDAIKLIAYLNDANPPGGDRLTPEQRKSALDSVKGTDVADPESVKIIQDQLDAACKKS